MSACSVCNSPVGDGANLCRTHTSTLTHLLRQIPDREQIIDRKHLDAFGRLVVRELRDRLGAQIPYQLGDEPIESEKLTLGLASELETTITRQDKLAVTSGAATSGEKPLMFNNRASQVRVELCAAMFRWSGAAAKHHEDTRDPLWVVGLDLVKLAEWLLRNVNTLRLIPDVGEAYAELNNAIRRAESAIDRPAHAARFVVGPCPEMLEDDTRCTGEVWAFIPVSEEKPGMLICTHEEPQHSWNTTQWLRVGPRIRQRIEATGWRPTIRRDAA